MNLRGFMRVFGHFFFRGSFAFCMVNIKRESMDYVKSEDNLSLLARRTNGDSRLLSF